MKNKPRPEDRLIGCLDIIRWRLVEAICEIDKQIAYLERLKKIKEVK